ncbi:kelch-like protein 18 [Onthophagus taurus]|uniref:kelch-like protein 18 n=1 Tax=Onthophagus taurus TaxID=166361 RepID=UPI000C20B2FC|nr:kelch-like protein 18 isoform X1 [Onthophagus taurus]XP_022916934.1 kelch-like protein 18 isoform X2 [Onthophagus taurus]XP_022916935.1 kelch-like protein 18 isoform X2 [Onthophagus taurus]XP_022916936.1 kelch-like protein 18 isoform X2 [Onthophagus taurus]XP_022916937.1 kelch-like protein 18 isoform X2 [Onthophagus taurus]XP_022916938.1 kelch-like protein 18 isoform X2 [Onthophagus taurus]
MSGFRSMKMELEAIDLHRNFYETNNESFVFQQNDLFPSSFPIMEEIRRQGKLCDVVLKIDDQSFSAHKIILASTIPYFHAMFTNDMVESRQQEIEIHGIEANALEALVNFAYSGRVVLDKSNVQSIMIGASFLQLSKVRDACAKYLLQRLHPQNALGIRQFADTLGCTTLVDSAEKYIEQCFHEVSLSEEYLNLPVQEVKSLLQRNELRVESEEQVFEACMRWVKYTDQRTHHLPELLAEVRLPLLSPLYLTDRVATEELIRSSHQCRDLLDEARVFHLIPERRPLLQSFRTKQRACEVRGHIYVVGGLNRHGDSLSTVEYYDPKTNTWHMAQAMSMLRSRLGVAVLRGKLYAFGGYNGKDRLASVEVYDATKKTWSMVCSMQCKRSALGACSLGDIIYVCGGYDGVTSLNSVERYHPDTNTWLPMAPMNKSRSAGAVIACQGYVYALGGHDGLSIFDSVERYDPNTNTWSEATPMLTKRCRLGVAMLGGKLYACGGYDGISFLQTVEVYDPNTNKWAFVAPMNDQRSRVALTANMGKLWAVGGYDGVSNLTSMEVYDPTTDTWTFASSMIAHEGGVGVGVISLP